MPNAPLTVTFSVKDQDMLKALQEKIGAAYRKAVLGTGTKEAFEELVNQRNEVIFFIVNEQIKLTK